MSDKVRVYEIAEEAGANSTEVIAKAKDLGIELKSPQSAVSFADAEEITNYMMTGKSSKLKKQAPAKKTVKKENPQAEAKTEEKVETKPEVTTEEKKVVEKFEKHGQEELKKEEEQYKKTMQVYAEYGMQRRRMIK